MKRNTNQNCKQDHSLKEIHAEYFQTLENKLLQESQKLTNIMGKSLIQDKSKKRFKFTLTPTKIVTQDLEKSRSRLTGKNETNKPEPIYMKRMKQLYQKFKQHNLHFGDNLQHIKQLCPRQKYETQRQKIYNLVNKYEQSTDQKFIAVICDREKLGRSKKLHRFCKESQSLKDTISTQSCKSLKNITEQSINYLGIERITLNDFEIINHIAQGKIGHVYTVRHKRTNFLCAVKKIQRSVFINNNKMLTQRIRQIKIQSFLDHPNIVQLYSVFTDQNHLYLLMELCSSGSLYQQLKAQSKFCEQKIRHIVKQICHAVEYMHDNDILHRDLKPQNILFHQNIVKICDFDWSVYSPLLRNTNCGTPVYTSPQIVQGLQYDNKVDIWNIGILTYELLYGRVPFQIRSEEDLSKVVDDDIYFPRSKPATPQIKDFILRCLSKNPKQRFTIAKLIDHQFLNPSVQAHNLT